MAVKQLSIILGLISIVAGESCVSPFEPVGGKCLYVNVTNFSWNEARKQCQAFPNVDADLASFPNCEQYETFTRYMAMNNPNEKDIWMGARTVYAPSDWEWVTLEPLETGVPFWYYLENYDSRKPCAASSKTYYYKLYADDCSQKKGLACTYTPSSSSDTVESSPVTVESPKASIQAACPNGSIQVGDFCYVFSVKPATFSEAEKNCREQYAMQSGELFYPSSCDEFGNLAHHIEASETPRPYWVGAIDVTGNQEWTWVNGGKVPLEFPYWSAGRPQPHNPPVPNNYCAIMHQLKRYYLYEELCSRSFNYICKVNANKV